MINAPAIFVECDICGYGDEKELTVKSVGPLGDKYYFLEPIIDGVSWFEIDGQIYCDVCESGYDPKEVQ